MHEINWEKLLESDDEVLLAQLGGEFTGLSAGPDAGRQNHERGLQWWAANVDSVRTVICSAPKVRETCTAKEWDRVALCTAVFDVLLAHYRVSFSTTITALAVRQGVLELCSVHWTPRS